jgi:hypothetical protein
MPSVNVVPAYESSAHSDGTYSGGSANYTNMGDSSDSTYHNFVGTGVSRRVWRMTQIAGAATIDTIDGDARGIDNTAPHTLRFSFHNGSSDVDDSSTFQYGTGWADRASSQNFQGSITPSLYNSGEFGLKRDAGADPNAASTSQFDMDVSYTLPAGGYAMLVGCWLPPLMSLASHALLFREVREILTPKIKTPGWIYPCYDYEIKKLIEAFQVRPVYV